MNYVMDPFRRAKKKHEEMKKEHKQKKIDKAKRVEEIRAKNIERGNTSNTNLQRYTFDEQADKEVCEAH